MELTWGGIVFWALAWGGIFFLSGYVLVRLLKTRDR